MNVNEEIMAKIATNKSLLKEFETAEGRTVYLNNGDEFQIQLYNPTSEEIAASIFIDGQELSNQLILRPAERIWLERYLDVARKFRFSTYKVEDNVETEKVISNNGVVEVKFYKKQQYTIKTTTYPYTYIDYNVVNYVKDYDYYNTKLTGSSDNYISRGATLKSINLANDNLLSSCLNSAENSITNCISTASLNLEPVQCAATIETGRTTQGSYSSQKFENVNSSFNSWAFKTEKIKILPMSRKPYTANDLEKIYCTECGRKLKTKYKFCPFCGTKIDY